ncbi:restriction endonuclease subunit S [Cellulosimicrobium funkei]|uniref:restriction endonuclease subunit S n=1 Tax=Cellulosimicrobium funkei TaxID=264251 RepID=UPI0034439D86
MSRIDELVAEHCPVGVEYKALRDLGTWTGGITPSKAERRYWDRGEIPWVTSMDISATKGREIRGTVTQAALDETSLRMVPGPSVAVVMRSNILRNCLPVGYIASDTTANQDLRLLTPGEGVGARYAYWALQAAAEKIRKTCVRTVGSMAAVDSKGFLDWRIPVPPRAVQDEIVRVLDSFADLEADLEAELEAELEGRRVQYAHYRDALLSFNEAGGARWVPMADLGSFVRGRRFTKADYADSGIPSIHYGEIYTHYGVSTTATVARVREDLRPSLRFAQPQDVVIAGVGETVADVAKAVAWLGDTPVAIHDDSFAFRSDADPTYISYVMQTDAFQAQKEQHVARGKVKRVSGAGLGKIVVPVPPLEEQRRIVGILDQFDALVNDLSSGLHAEIEARRQQNAYYRDRLLAFKEAV